MESRKFSKRQLFDELIDEVRRSQEATARFDHAVADAIGVNRTDMRCIDVLQRAGALTAGQLAEATGLTTGAMTTALDRLERSGFVRRVRDERDRRRVLVEVTPTVHEVAGRFYRGHAESADALYHEYTAEQLELLLGFVRRGRVFNEESAAELESRNRELGGSWAAPGA